MGNGTITFVENRTTHGAVAVHRCKQNYTLIGNGERQCGDNGKWSGESPKCLFDWCPSPPAVSGATVSVDGNKAGSIATYACYPGFILFGPPVSTNTIGAFAVEFEQMIFENVIPERRMYIGWNLVRSHAVVQIR